MIAASGNYPNELNNGLLAPLQKPGKKRGPPENLRPIILLSVLRKILSVIMIKRDKSRIKKVLSKSQAAYQSGRSKELLLQKTRNYTFFLLTCLKLLIALNERNY